MILPVVDKRDRLKDDSRVSVRVREVLWKVFGDAAIDEALLRINEMQEENLIAVAELV